MKFGNGPLFFADPIASVCISQFSLTQMTKAIVSVMLLLYCYMMTNHTHIGTRVLPGPLFMTLPMYQSSADII